MTRITEVTKRQDVSIANLTGQISDLTGIIKEFQATIGDHQGYRSHGDLEKATRIIKLDLPKFTGIELDFSSSRVFHIP